MSLSGCTGISQQSADTPTVRLYSPSGENISVGVEVADDDAEREQGLMFREYLARDAGMLFVFPKERPLSFWMKNTLIPLDILYFDAHGGFVSSVTMTPCREDPCPLYHSAGPAKYALEVPAGLVEGYRIGEGWRISEIPAH